MKISLYENVPVPDDDLAEQELYDDALAHIWEGYMQKWPHRKFDVKITDPRLRGVNPDILRL